MIKLVMIPYAGGNSWGYADISKRLKNNNIDCILYDYPGHGKRVTEELMDNIDKVREDCVNYIQSNISDNDTLFIFGHSLGALITYEVVKDFNKSKNRVQGMIVSGMYPRDMKESRGSSKYYSNKNFIENIMKLGGIPLEILNNPEAVDFFGEIIKNDYQIFDSIRASSELINIPILAFSGNEDKNFSEEKVSFWEKLTNSNFKIHNFQGNHFFIFDNVKPIVDSITEFIEETLK